MSQVNEDTFICMFCQGSGEGQVEDSTCFYCKGTGEVPAYDQDTVTPVEDRDYYDDELQKE